MAIIVTCRCGQHFRAEDGDAGLKAACPICQQVLVIPGARLFQPHASATASQQPRETATIIATCQCGQQFRAKDDDAGMKVQCPKCQQVLIVPGSRPTPPTPSTSSSHQPGRIKTHSQMPIVLKLMPFVVSLVIVVAVGLVYLFSQGGRGGETDRSTSQSHDPLDFDPARERGGEADRPQDNAEQPSDGDSSPGRGPGSRKRAVARAGWQDQDRNASECAVINPQEAEGPDTGAYRAIAR